jgi:AmmeMemoRadiSam system protein A
MFTDAEKDALLRIARAAIHEQVTGETWDVGLPTSDSRPAASVLRAASDKGTVAPTGSGAFVTIRRGGQLRGCLGTLECRGSLLEEVARCAARAAREDPRFPPVDASELAALAIEVSILGPLEEISPPDPGAIVIGRHGLVVERGRRRGLLLPQVASEWGWTPEQLLAHTCVKAGLPRDAWQHGAIVYRFEAVVFGD